MFVYLCTYLHKSVDFSRSLSAPDVSEMCGALYKCIIIVDIIAIQALVAGFIIISLRDDSRFNLYGIFLPAVCIRVKFISVIICSYKCRDLYLTLCTYDGASNYFMLHTSEEISGVGKASGASAAAPGKPQEVPDILFSDICT